MAGDGVDFVVAGPIFQPPINDSSDVPALAVRARVVQVPDDGEGSDSAANENLASDTAAITVNDIVDAVFTSGNDVIDLRESAGFLNDPSQDNPFFEDLNFLDALNGNDVVQLPDGSDALFAAEFEDVGLLGRRR